MVLVNAIAERDGGKMASAKVQQIGNSRSHIFSKYLACERKWVFELLMLSGGMMGAYTFVLRGGVFCNAQTANFVMMAVAFGQGDWLEGIYYFVPITAYFMGSLLSEILPSPVKRLGLLRWDTYLIGFEMAVLFIIGCLPLSVPNHVVQVMVNFIASMQYNTFRQAEGVPMATTFCTNHLRQTGIGVAKYIRKRDSSALQKALRHAYMLFYFSAGGIAMAFFCSFLKERAIWITLPFLAIIFGILSYADLILEHDKLEEKPQGH